MTRVRAVITRRTFWIALVICLWGVAVSRAGAQEAKTAVQPESAAEHTDAPPAKADAAPAHDAAHPDAGAQHESGDHKAGSHDPYDLSHANASAYIKSVEMPQFDTSIYSFLVFLILLAVL